MYQLTNGTSRFGFAGQVFRVVTTRMWTSGRHCSRMSDLQRRVDQLNFNAKPLTTRCPRPADPRAAARATRSAAG